MADEQLFGREETEASQGYVPMPEPVADKPDPELEQAQAIERIIDRDPPSPIIERQYVRQDDDSKPQPDNRTVELDRAAEDLAQNRMAEAATAEIERDLELANQIDAARGLRPDLLADAQQPQDQQPVAQPEQQSAPADGIDPEVAAAFRNPKILAVLEQHHQENTAKVKSAVNQAAAWAQENAAVAVAAIFARPELQGIPPNQLPGAMAALAKTNPALHNEIRGQINNVGALDAAGHASAADAAAALCHRVSGVGQGERRRFRAISLRQFAGIGRGAQAICPPDDERGGPSVTSKSCTNGTLIRCCDRRLVSKSLQTPLAGEWQRPVSRPPRSRCRK